MCIISERNFEPLFRNIPIMLTKSSVTTTLFPALSNVRIIVFLGASEREIQK